MSTPLKVRLAQPGVISNAAFIATTAVELTGGLVINALPAIVSALTDAGRLDVAMAGYIVGIDVAAQVGGGLLFLSHGRRRWLSTCLFFGLALVLSGNVLSCFALSTVMLIATRLVAGCGAGVIRSAYFALLARARDPARALARFNVTQTVVMFGALSLFPRLTHIMGWLGPYVVLAALAALMFATARWWPKEIQSQDVDSMKLTFGRAGAVCLFATFLYFVAQVGLWAFAEKIGETTGAPMSSISLAVAFAGIPGITASLIASVVSARTSMARALMLGLCLTLVALLLLPTGWGFWPMAAGLSLFYFAWCITIPFTFSVAVASDRKLSTASAFIVAVGLGAAAGPACAGKVVLEHGTFTLIILSACCTMTSIGLFFIAIKMGRAPRLVDVDVTVCR